MGVRQRKTTAASVDVWGNAYVARIAAEDERMSAAQPLSPPLPRDALFLLYRVTLAARRAVTPVRPRKNSVQVLVRAQRRQLDAAILLLVIHPEFRRVGEWPRSLRRRRAQRQRVRRQRRDEDAFRLALPGSALETRQHVDPRAIRHCENLRRVARRGGGGEGRDGRSARGKRKAGSGWWGGSTSDKEGRATCAASPASRRRNV